MTNTNRVNVVEVKVCCHCFFLSYRKNKEKSGITTGILYFFIWLGGY